MRTNFLVKVHPVSDLYLYFSAILAETVFTGDLRNIDAIRKTAAELLFGKNYDNRTFAHCVDTTEYVDVWVYEPGYGWDNTAMFSVKDLKK